MSGPLAFDDALPPHLRGRVFDREGRLLGHGSGPATEMGRRLGAALREAARSLLAEYEDEIDCHVAFLAEIGMEFAREPPGPDGGLPGGERMSRQRRNWTDAEDELLGRLADSGASPREIGERIGRSESAVRSRMKLLRISRRDGHVRKYESWGEEELAAPRELHGEGMLLTEIAERLGCARSSVVVKARAPGLWHKNPPPDADIPAEPAIPGRSVRRVRPAKSK